MINLLLSFLISFALLIIAMTVHEFSHAFIAYRLGDATAKHSRRLTLNPLAHIDPIWTFLMPLALFISTHGQFVFGMARPVPINYWALRKPKKDIIWIGLAGPAANFIFALILSLILKLLQMPVVVSFLITHLIMINVVLGVFNLIPIPPLDGSRILTGILPEQLSIRYASLEPYSFIILLLALWSGILDFIIWPAVNMILKLLSF